MVAVSARFVERPAGERVMRFALAGVIVFLVLYEEMELSLGHGLSVKNVLLYLLALALAMKFTVRQDFAVEAPEIHACFAVIIIYAIFSMLAAAFVIEYRGYKLIASGMSLKNRLIDHAIFFLVFFYGLRASRNAHALIRFLLFTAVIANCVAVLDAAGVIQLGDMEQREDGRVEGLIGESNVYGSYLCMLLPGILAAGVMTHGVRRIFWFCGLIVSTIALLLTVSRGAYVAVFVSAVWSAMLLRRYLSLGRIVAWGTASIAMIFALVAIVSVRYGDLLSERFARSAAMDAETVSSGRTAIWWHAIGRMAEEPLSLITGLGWYAYEALPFKTAPHNHYLWLWFNIGLVGLACGVMLFGLAIRRARDAVAYMDPHERPALFAFIMGALAYATAAFFVDLQSPSAWYWAYAGLAMRIAVNAQARGGALQRSVRPVVAAQSLPNRDSLGWIGSARR